MKRIERGLGVLAAAMTLVLSGVAEGADESGEGEYLSQVAPIFARYCTGCHNAEEKEGELSLETFAELSAGGEHGAEIVAGKVNESRLIRLIEKQDEPVMPPEGNEGPTAAEIAVIRRWIEGGAKAPADVHARAMPKAPKISVKGEVREPVLSMAMSPDGTAMAVGKSGIVEIRAGVQGGAVATLRGIAGKVNDVGFSGDGKFLFAAAGEPGQFGELWVYRTSDWGVVRTIRGHRDCLYSAGMTDDGSTVATGSYDQKIKLWNVADGKELRTLTGHNGAINDLAFQPGGKILASASTDRTVKLWNSETGERLDTLGQPEKEQQTVAFSPDGRFVVAGGGDNRLRAWEIREKGKEGTNPLVYSRFAHAGPILKTTFSKDGKFLLTAGEDRAIKVWETGNYTPLKVYETQPDWTPALAVSGDGGKFAVGRLDGSVQQYEMPVAGGSGSAGAQSVTSGEAGIMGEAPKPMEVAEKEPNETVDDAKEALTVPGVVSGVLSLKEGKADRDVFRFRSPAGKTWVIETNAARMMSPADTMLEVLDAKGEGVPRVLLRAVRDSYVEFRPVDSTANDIRLKNWQEMSLNQYIYLNGEVVKTFRMPQGPDSGFQFYSVNGQRKCFFDTTGITHALGEPGYVVEAYAPGSQFVDNGLPVFPVHYMNDDDGERKLGSDSRMLFTAPADGEYLIRVRDVRGFGGDEYKYTLTIREPMPTFGATFTKNLNVLPGSGQRLVVTLDRIDGFEGPVEISVENLPEGYSVSGPMVVEPGHLEGRMALNASPEAKAADKEAWGKVKVIGKAKILGQEVTKELGNLGDVNLGGTPKVIAHLLTNEAVKSGGEKPSDEIVIEAGTTVTAMVRIERLGFDGEMKFEVDNLPHGMIVDNIGLNGVMVRQGETERQIFLTAESWVPETTRMIYAVGLAEGNPATKPVKLRVVRPGSLAGK